MGKIQNVISTLKILDFQKNNSEGFGWFEIDTKVIKHPENGNKIQVFVSNFSKCQKFWTSPN